MRNVYKGHKSTMLIAMVIFVFLYVIPSLVHADDFYVITATYKTQTEAQQSAAIKGGWVLNTNFYNKLTPGLFAVVRGPFKSKSGADSELASLGQLKPYAGSYVRNAGIINIEIKIGNKKLSPQMLAALLGEVRLDVSEHKGGSNPCEPQEPYKELSLSFVTVERGYDAKNDEESLQPKETQLNIGGFWQIQSSGVIDRMRICTE